MNAAEAPSVHWLIAAQQQLMNALARKLARSADDTPYGTTRGELDRVLAATFPQASSIIVRERLQGFRPKPDLHVLLVEVFPDPKQTSPGQEPRTDPEAHIVKIADDPQELLNEWQGWQRSRPPGMYADSILTMLTRGPLNDQQQPISLVYGEGHSVLASGDAMELEAAFIDCCLFGTPTVRSLEHCLQRLFSRLYRRYYRRSFVTKRTETIAAAAQLKERVTKGLAKWQDSLQHKDGEPGAEPPPASSQPSPAFEPIYSDSTSAVLGEAPASAPNRQAVAQDHPNDEASFLSDEERLRLRRQTLRFLANQTATFFDPCDYLQFLIDHPQHAPRILCGCAHGDLHGRNVLVSPMDEAVGSMCVYDYEDTRPNNAIGWDFVKLETELKIRVYPKLFRGKLDHYARHVHQFEETLARRTEHIHDNGWDEKWPVPGNRRGERLARLILTIRREALRCLGTLQQRQRDWLEEYYFLLLCYGCSMAKIPYRSRECIAGYVAAGVAARRLDLPWRAFKGRIQKAKELARQELKQISATIDGKTIDDYVQVFYKSELVSRMSYHACLAFATVWSRAGKERQHELQAAAKFLGLLRNEFPHALEIDEELVLVHLELGQPSEANKLLDEMEARYGDQVSDEILCRWGRREKDEAVKHWNTHELTAIARQHFAKAIDWYRKAYARSRSYYPAVNVASLQYLLSGGNADAKVDIDEAHKALQQWQQPAADELCWFNATWGELFFLRGEHDAAKQKYQAAVEGQDCPQQYKQTMLRQLRLLLRLANQQATAFWTEPSLEEVFGTEACKALPA